MTDIWFYELTQEPVENVLPGLLAKHQQRGDRVSIVGANVAQIEELSSRIWAYEDVSFIAHGMEGDAAPNHHAIWLSTSPENSNASTFRYCVGGQMPEETEGFSRISIMFESEDEQKSKARDTWKRMKAANHDVKYWKKDDTGRWVDQAAAAQA